MVVQPKLISSPANTAVRQAARLGRQRNRHESRLFMIEGEDLLAAALARGMVPRQCFCLAGEAAGAAGRRRGWRGGGWPRWAERGEVSTVGP